MEHKDSGEQQGAGDGKKSEKAYGHVSRVIGAGNVVTLSRSLEDHQQNRLRCLKSAENNASQAQQDGSCESFVAAYPTDRRWQAYPPHLTQVRTQLPVKSFSATRSLSRAGG
jgi:hypothetical protein